MAFSRISESWQRLRFTIIDWQISRLEAKLARAYAKRPPMPLLAQEPAPRVSIKAGESAVYQGWKITNHSDSDYYIGAGWPCINRSGT